MVDATEPIREHGDSNAMTVAGLRRVMREAFDSKLMTDRQKAEAAMRRGICYLVREIAVHGHTFGILQFAHHVTQPGWFGDPALAAKEMDVMANTPGDVPPVYYALASDVFDYCARRLEKAARREAKHGEQIIEPTDEREPAASGQA